jgi:hypothetical protein
VNFVIKDMGVSVDSVVNVGDFHKGGEADVIYMIRNESSNPIKPSIFYARGTRIDNYSAVNGQGFKDAPDYVEQWIKVEPIPIPIPPQTAQSYVVSLTMPDGNFNIPNKFAFQVGVGVGEKLQIAVNPWWLVTMKN